jgi:single-stranded-DNA-specific exonuclease
VIDPSALRYRSGDQQAWARLLAELPQISPLLAELLVGRGHTDPAAVKRFLSVDLETLNDPLALRDMDKAVALLRQSMQEGLRILIHGDYDCDGICATALLLDGLSELGADVDYHIPDRFVEGYGLSHKAVERCQEEGFGVLLSVDCGSSSHHEIEVAMQAGLRVIITDHHQVPAEPPRPHALVNPQRPDCDYPFKGLCGTGVAFKLLQALRGEAKDQPAHLLDLVALATIADVVPLVEENRVLVQLGLTALSNSDRPGLKALLAAAGRPPEQPVDAFTVAFTLAPRLNASGRLEHARAGVELLRCGHPEQARQQASQLQALNEERKETEQAIGREIEARLSAEPWRYQNGAIVEWGEGWHEGVIGITAGRLAEKYGVPTLVIALDSQGGAKGSGRSPENVDLYLALQECGDLFRKFGGHPRAGGFSLAAERLEELRERFCQAARTLSTGQAPVWIDGTLGLSQITFGLARGLDRLEPYGEANPRPVFLLEGVTVLGQRTVGKNHDHLQLELEQGGRRQRAIAFRQGDEIDALDIQNRRYDLLCQVGIEQFNGEDRIRLQVTGIVQPRPEESPDSPVVDRRNSRSRRSELEHWLGLHEQYLAICRDQVRASQLYPHLTHRFGTYQGVEGRWEGLVLLTPPHSEQELARVMELCRPRRVVILFGRQELEQMRQTVEASFWSRAQATAVWRELKRQRPDNHPRAELVERLAGQLRLARECVEDILQAFLETGALCEVPHHSCWTLGAGNGIRLEDTRCFAALQERRLAHQRLLRLFSGPELVSGLTSRFSWLGGLPRGLEPSRPDLATEDPSALAASLVPCGDWQA